VFISPAVCLATTRSGVFHRCEPRVGNTQMVISYKKLWVILEQRRITKKELCRRADVSMSSIRNMTRDQNVCLDVLARICAALHVNLGDIAEFVEV